MEEEEPGPAALAADQGEGFAQQGQALHARQIKLLYATDMLVCRQPKSERISAMIVFGSTLSPHVRKGMVFGAGKGLALELQPAGMGRGGPDFEAASPFRKMPGFKDGDFLISDSSAIVTYLEAKYSDPNLIPLGPEARARTIWFDELADTLMMAAGGAIFGKRFVQATVLKMDCEHRAAE